MFGAQHATAVTLDHMMLDDLTRAHAEFTATVQQHYVVRAHLILEARKAGYTWPQIAGALDMTVHGAIKASRMTGAE